MPNGKYAQRRKKRKELYEDRRRIRAAALEEKKTLYERDRASIIGLGIRSIRRGAVPRKPSTRPYREARVETIIPEQAPSREPLIDVFDEGKHLRVDVQLKDIPWPEDTIGELGEVSFKHGVLELKLKKRELEELTKAEEEALEAAEEGKATARVKEKLMMKLKKRRKSKPSLRKKPSPPLT
jgi:hypothetical protein